MQYIRNDQEIRGVVRSTLLRAIFCMNESQTQQKRNPAEIACFFPPLSSSHRSGLKQSQSLGSVVVWRDYPFPFTKDYLWILFVCHLLCFPCLEVFSLSFKQCCFGFGSKVCRAQQSRACLHLKGIKKTGLFSLALAYFVGSLPNLYHYLSLHLLLLCSAQSNIPLATLFLPPCHVKPQYSGNECHLTSFSLLIFLQVEWTHWQWKEKTRNPSQKYHRYLK